MKVEQIITKPVELEIIGVTLLSVEEAEKLPIRLRQYNREWWLRSRGVHQLYATSVYYDGSVNDEGYNVNYAFNCVRPALIIKNLGSSALQISDVFIFDGKKFEIIDDETAFCLEDIGCRRFRDNWRVKDANNYESSDVKKFVDAWFKEAGK